MARPKTVKGGKIRVMLGDDAEPIVYAAPCGLSSRSLTITKGLEEVNIPDCDDPDAIDWVGRDATSLSMAINGEGVLAEESTGTWLDAMHNIESVPVKIEIGFSSETITYTGRMHVETFAFEAPNGRRATSTVSMQSDGEMVRVTTPVP